jgi:hypothetical protein
LIVYDAQADLAYWLYIQAFFEAQPEFDISRAGDIMTVHLPTSNIVNQAVIRQFARYKENILTQIQGVIRHHV